MNSDFKDLLKLFKKYNAKYLIVGGYAVMEYSEPRYTKDIDLWIDSSSENATAVYNALAEFGAPLKDLNPKDFEDKDSFYSMGVAPFRVDIIMFIDGVPFNDAFQRKKVVNFEECEFFFISLDDLILIKEKAGRPQDILDVKALKATKKK